MHHDPRDVGRQSRRDHRAVNRLCKESTVRVTQVTSKISGTTRLKDEGVTVSLCASGLCVPATVCKFVAVIATVFLF